MKSLAEPTRTVRPLVVAGGPDLSPNFVDPESSIIIQCDRTAPK